MDANVMKKMIVLKNLESNFIEEAYIVFKKNFKVHEFEKIDDKKQVREENISDKDYVIKEAEMIVDEYISKLENKDYITKDISLKQSYKRLKIISVALSLFSLLNFVLFFLK